MLVIVEHPASTRQRLSVISRNLDVGSRTLRTDSGTVRLSHRESRILGYLGNRAGVLVKTEELFRQVWNVASVPMEGITIAQKRRVRRAMQRLFGKIELDATSPSFFLTAHGVGYVALLSSEHLQMDEHNGLGDCAQGDTMTSP